MALFRPDNLDTAPDEVRNTTFAVFIDELAFDVLLKDVSIVEISVNSGL